MVSLIHRLAGTFAHWIFTDETSVAIFLWGLIMMGILACVWLVKTRYPRVARWVELPLFGAYLVAGGMVNILLYRTVSIVA